MDEILKITKETLSSMFSRIKTGIENTAKNYADSKDDAIIAAALIGKKVETIKLLNFKYLENIRKDKGTFLAVHIGFNSTIPMGYYYSYSNESAPIQINADNLAEILLNFESYNASYPFGINKDEWSTLTPIIDENKQISAIYKGETVGDFTKWIIMLNTGSDCETEDQNYTAYKKGNTRYVYGTHSYYYEMYNKPWELWLPSDAAAGSVIIDI